LDEKQRDTMVFIIGTAFIFISSCLTIKAKTIHSTTQLVIFKPLTMGFILCLAIVFGYHHPDLYFFAIIGGLFLSLIGDVFLIFPEKYFLRGLIGFLIAHLLYIVAFSSGRSLTVTWWILLVFILYGLSAFMFLLPNLNKMMLPVGLYVSVIIVMTWQAWERWLWFQDRMTLYAAVGAVLFLISDSLLAFNRFKRSFQMAEILILSTYFSAQYLIVLSVQSN
jgi:uncharacterized membrane protein YhhN